MVVSGHLFRIAIATEINDSLSKAAIVLGFSLQILAKLFPVAKPSVSANIFHLALAICELGKKLHLSGHELNSL